MKTLIYRLESELFTARRYSKEKDIVRAARDRAEGAIDYAISLAAEANDSRALIEINNLWYKKYRDLFRELMEGAL